MNLLHLKCIFRAFQSSLEHVNMYCLCLAGFILTNQIFIHRNLHDNCVCHNFNVSSLYVMCARMSKPNVQGTQCVCQCFNHLRNTQHFLRFVSWFWMRFIPVTTTITLENNCTKGKYTLRKKVLQSTFFGASGCHK